MTASVAAAPAETAPQTARLRGFHPGWYGAVMGTAIVGIIAYQNPGNAASLADVSKSIGVAVVLLAALLAVALGVAYVLRWLVHPDAARADFTHPVAGALYATFPGGILVLAIAVATVGPSLAPNDVVMPVVTILGIGGVALAFAVSVAFAAILFVGRDVQPQAANGAWFIPPVVNIIAPLALLPLAPHIAPGDLPFLLAVGYAFWGMGLLLFVLVASLLYDRLVFHPLPGAPLAPSLWIGLGPIGVGALALVRLGAAGAPVWGSAAAGVSAASSIAATALWGFGLWWLAAAVMLLVVYLRQGPLPYGIGWWAFTFPLGAYTASTVALARAWQSQALEWLAVALFAGLVTAWVIVSLRTAQAVASGEAWRR